MIQNKGLYKIFAVALLITSYTSFAMNSNKMRCIKPNFNCNNDEIYFVKSQKLSKSLVEKLNKKFKNKIPLGSKNFREVLLVSSKNFNIYIYDIKTGKEILGFYDPFSLYVSTDTEQMPTFIFPEEITENNGNFFIAVYVTFEYRGRVSHMNTLYNIFNDEVKKTDEGKKRTFMHNSCFLHMLPEKKVEKKNYTLECKQKDDHSEELLIKHKQNSHQTKIAKNKFRTPSICVSPMEKSRYALVHHQELPLCTREHLMLYDIYTGSPVQNKKSRTAIDFFEIDQYVKANHPILVDAMFSKKDNFLVITFMNYFIVYDLKQMKIVLQEESSENISHIIIPESEKQLGIATDKCICIFDNPIVGKSEKKERLRFLQNKGNILGLMNL